jgi:hypothetical protein
VKHDFTGKKNPFPSKYVQEQIALDIRVIAAPPRRCEKKSQSSGFLYCRHKSLEAAGLMSEEMHIKLVNQQTRHLVLRVA